MGRTLVPMSKPTENHDCPYCRSPIESGQEKIICPECGIAHHAECWKSNEKCSVYGCDGWSAWRELPEDPPSNMDSPVPKQAAPQKPKPVLENVHCIKCGAEIGPGKMLCRRCRKAQPKAYFENCFGPSMIMLSLFVGLIVLVVRLVI